jgi:hypothetical protein
MNDRPTSFIWYELMTSDTEAAKAFYSEVVGWEARAFADGGHDYSVLEADGRGVGGVMRIPPEAREAGARPCWIGYIAVGDVDAVAARIEAAGGTVHKDIMDIPGVGRIAMVSDPQGAPFYLIAPTGEDQPPAPPMTPGMSAGTSFTAATGKRRSVSIRASSDGPRRRRWIWGRWAPTSSSPPGETRRPRRIGSAA